MLFVRYFKFTWQKIRDLIQLGFILCILLNPLGCTLNLASTETSPTSTTSAFKITTDIGTNSDDWAGGMIVQSNGKILLAGNANVSGLSYDFAVARYNSDSTLDSSFGTGGKVTTDIGTTSADQTSAVVVQSDGKILVSGSFNAGGSYDFVVVRYNSDGTLDASFGTGGKVTTDIGTNSSDSADAITLQSDGKILLAGYSNTGGSYDFVVVRYNSDGTLDASFGTGGKVATDIGTNSIDYASGVVVQSDGKILLGGKSNTSGSYDFVAVRYSSTGTLDASFGTGGKVTTDIGTGTDDRPTAIKIQSDGKILLAGNSDAGISNDFSVVRYSSTGTLDSSFGTSGKVTTDIGTSTDDGLSAMQIESDGKILLAGGSDAGDPGNSYNFVLMRILANGQ